MTKYFAIDEDNEEEDFEYEPAYEPNSWFDDFGIRHIVVRDNNYLVEYEFKNGKLIKTYDMEEQPF